MFQHILVPLDGSTRAERAIPVAARLSMEMSTEVSESGSLSLSTIPASKEPARFWHLPLALVLYP